MKYSFTKVLFLAATLLSLGACKKAENKVVLEGGTAPQLSASLPMNSAIPLESRTKNDVAIKFNWTNPDYRFNTGVSSHDVRYVLQFDVPGGGFASSALQERSYSGQLSVSLSQEELNKMLIQMEMPFGEESEFEVRVKSTLGEGAAQQVSNALVYKVTPYVDVAIPLPPTDDLWLVGSATPNDWNNPTTEAQKLTRTSFTTWEITMNFVGGGDYLIIPENGQWKKYSVADKSLPDLWQGGTFGQELPDDIPGPPTAGVYKLELDFVLGRFKLTPQ